jgi:hypothetical protein
VVRTSREIEATVLAALCEALNRFEQQRPEKAKLVKLKYFAVLVTTTF